MRPGDEYTVKWLDGDRQRYRVEEIDGNKITFRRWIASKQRWTPWVGVHHYHDIAPLVVEESGRPKQRLR